MLILAILLSAVLSYLLGSFNSSILVVRLLKHKDIRDYGSHNAGLTNTLRCFGKGCAALTLDRKSTRLNSSHRCTSRMPSSA